jgi:hypothetical protein
MPLEAWMSVCVYSMFVLSRVGSGLVTGWSPVQGVLLSVRLRDWRNGQGPKSIVQPLTNERIYPYITIKHPCSCRTARCREKMIIKNNEYLLETQPREIIVVAVTRIGLSPNQFRAQSFSPPPKKHWGRDSKNYINFICFIAITAKIHIVVFRGMTSCSLVGVLFGGTWCLHPQVPSDFISEKYPASTFRLHVTTSLGKIVFPS